MIPARAPIGDRLNGHVIEVDQRQLVVVDLPEGITSLYSGNLVIRYGVRYLGKPHLAIVPGLIALDYGEMITGEDAWSFLLKKSNLYPRADVVGYRHDGVDEMIPIKKLDLAISLMPLVYADLAAVLPIAQPTALIASPQHEIAPRILEYLPRFESLEAWRSAVNPKLERR